MSCPYLLEVAAIRRPNNGLNVEIGTPMDRCSLKPKPRHEGRVLAWIGSGGSPIECCYPCVSGSESECKPTLTLK